MTPPSSPIVRKRTISNGKAVRAPVSRDDSGGYQARNSSHYIQPTGDARWEVLTAEDGTPIVPTANVRVSDDLDPAIHGWKSLGDARAAVAVLQMEDRVAARSK